MNMRSTRLVVLAVATAVLSASASAQNVPTQKTVTLEMAQSMAQEAMATCRANGYRVTVLVVDALNIPKAMLRDDGATPATAQVAMLKATSAMLFNAPSGPAQAPPPGTPPPPAIVPGTINAQGGLPIKVGDVTIGAIAVSGAPGGDKDTVCAAAGLAKVADKLK
jgi:uncharacterized protein GlcG (DUF336 family)